MHDALDAVIADIREHRIAGGPGGFFTALRHIELLGHLAIRLAADAHHHLNEDQQTSSARHPAETLSQTAGHVGRAVAHYTLALTPLAARAKPGARASLDWQLDAIDRHRDLHAHLSHAHQALDEARASLTGPNPPPGSQGSTPPPPTTAARTNPRPLCR
ncbi:hypothetical protein [Streptomyces zingiberis]|uniref:Uncharacterized protein n=1 Tax=Streptomyces zingiberis TaxID=2053010 RepID=A0ABX1C3U3_9ACTN|nr:hypothetical protein [Streptomyces zingiberis]NJQ03318.1 hypothetical protein [Streptomyces zingiberis]